MSRNEPADPMAYKATSLDFISRPNPVEPQSVPQKHPLHGTPRLEQTSKDNFLRILLDETYVTAAAATTDERPHKRRRSREEPSKLLHLPELPAVKNATKRMRIPPTLSGLHQPPPNAGILPSISVEQPVKRNEDPTASNDGPVVKQHASASATHPSTQSAESRPRTPRPSSRSARPKRNKWSEEETATLLKGVARFGIGNWTAILNCPDYHFERRTAIDLKDRFRVCCPEYGKGGKGPKTSSARKTSLRKSRPDLGRDVISNKPERKSSPELRELGIDEPFEKSKRRPRTRYTPAEDAALLRGFEKYSNSWASIQHDPELGLSMRKPTDLRDRLRTKFPEHYRKAGLAPRPDVFPKKPDRRSRSDNKDESMQARDDETTQHEATYSRTQRESEAARPEKENKDPTPGHPTKVKPVASLLQYDDVFWGAPLDDDEDSELIRPTLDRRILDWPSDAPRPVPAIGTGSIDPLVTLNPPTSRRPPPTSSTIQSAAALPSLADITSVANDFTEHLELPTLVGMFGSLDDDARGGHFPSLEELLS